jgi:hypothetical protein
MEWKDKIASLFSQHKHVECIEVLKNELTKGDDLFIYLHLYMVRLV